MKKSIIGIYRNCDFVTMLSSVFGIIGIICAFNAHINLAIFSLVMSGICDSFDGVLARKRNNTKKEMIYGCEMDSLSDIVCFGVLPIVISINDGINGWWANVVYIIYVLTGIIRLAYYNTLYHIDENSKGYFIGLPITSVAILYPVFWLIFRMNELANSSVVIILMFLSLAISYITRVKIKKIDTKWRLVLATLGVLFIVVAIVIKHLI